MPQPDFRRKIFQALNQATEYKDICFRNVAQLYANRDDILSPAGSFIAGGRYNFRNAFGVIYLSCIIPTCFGEMLKAATTLGIHIGESLPRTVVGVRVTLSKVLDLTNPRLRRSLTISASTLRAAGWERIQEESKEEAPTQLIGRCAYEAGFEAILVPSAACQGNNIDVFPDNLLPSSEISVVNDGRLLDRRISFR